MSGGKSDSDTQTIKVQVPEFLRPFVNQGADVAGGTLGRLESQLADATAADLVSPLTQDQLASFDIARQSAQGPLADLQQQFLPATQTPTSALNALRNTAGGEFLFGGQGFDRAVDAAVRAAQPRILSAFGGAGRADGGLARAAIGEAATDAFASQFGQERGRQLSAANALLNQQNQSARAFQNILGNRVGLLGNIGGQQQQQAQRELLAPINAQQDLLGATLQGLPVSSFLGQQTVIPDQGSSLASGLTAGLGGALTGAQLGSAFPGIGTGFGAAGGGAIGLLGGLLS